MMWPERAEEIYQSINTLCNNLSPEDYFPRLAEPTLPWRDPHLKAEIKVNGWWGGEWSEACLDGDLALVLTEGNSPKALTSFNLVEDWTDILQIRGLRGESDFLKPLGRWERGLVFATEAVSRALGSTEIRILPSFKINLAEAKLDPETAHLRYDVVPQRSGYRYSETKKRWVKQLS